MFTVRFLHPHPRRKRSSTDLRWTRVHFSHTCVKRNRAQTSLCIPFRPERIRPITSRVELVKRQTVFGLCISVSNFVFILHTYCVVSYLLITIMYNLLIVFSYYITTKNAYLFIQCLKISKYLRTWKQLIYFEIMNFILIIWNKTCSKTFKKW